VFCDLPAGPAIPHMILKVEIPERSVELDVNAFALASLGLTVERIGPRNSLGLLTIANTMDTINVGSLVESLDKLAADHVGRAVVRWTDSAAPLDREILSWLQQAAVQAGLAEVNDSRFPPVPGSIRELHLSQVPNGDESEDAESDDVDNPYYPGLENRLERVHNSDAAAIAAALRSAYEVLPLDELLQEMQKGSALTRAAAIAAGGGRLPSEQLSLLLGYADDSDPRLQQAALTALRHFGEQAAIDKLLHYLHKGAEPLATTATESLASSRYAAAHAALLDVLKNEPPESKRAIVTVLARYPRPIWSETIYEVVRNLEPGVGAEALRALVRIGHPKLLEVLEQALQNGDQELSSEAFQLLVSRTDAASEALALDYTLEWMKDAPPTQEMTNLLNRTRDPRAVPLLLQHFRQSDTNRSTIINTLALIGDQTVADIIVEKYEGLQNYEKTAALQALQQLRSPVFRKLAGQALLTSDSSLINAACQGLQAEASPEAVTLLAEAFATSSSPQAWSYISNALATLATSAARQALREARDSGIGDKRNLALNALQHMQRRSPGYQYVYRADQSVRQEKWDEAIAAFSMALKLDPDLTDAYVGRAGAYLRQKKYKEAREDYTKSLELDPYGSESVTGLAIVLVYEGNYREGIQFVEDAREKFANDHVYAYNTACVYGRAIEHLRSREASADRDKEIAELSQKAIAELKRSVDLGFQDFEWMRQDPDLVTVHDNPEFQALHSPTQSEEQEGQKDDGLIEDPF
jgi:HEAT repeat protein